MTTDERWERRLGVSTAAATYEREDANHSRYQPTDYAVLERLAGSGWLRREDALVDYGCGKGRVGIFLSHALGMRTVGVEYDAQVFGAARANRDAWAARNPGRGSADFVCASAENFDPAGMNRFYFFNPFSVKILRAVLGRIYDSWYENPRPLHLFFYYCTDDYLSCLMTAPLLRFCGEIDCRDLYHNPDPREKILIFAVGDE